MLKLGWGFALLGVVMMVSCGRVATPTPSPVENTGVAAAATSTPTLPTPETRSVSEPILTPSPVNFVSTSILTPTQVSTSTLDYFLEGDLFIFNEISILQLSLLSGRRSYLLEEQPNWLDWFASFSQDGKLGAYLIKNQSRSELWWSSLDAWQPQLVATLPVIDYQYASLTWLATSRYLLLQLTDEGEGTTVPSLIGGYIINIGNGEIVTGANKQVYCSILALSPRTNHLATWCSEFSGEASEIVYLVIETDGELWFSNSPPETVIFEEPWIDPLGWSIDGQYVAYIGIQGRPFLYYTATDQFEPVLLLDRRSLVYRSFNFSPDNRYLSYRGDCLVDCTIVMDVSKQQIIWTSQELIDGSGFDLAWSPDSHYFAITSEEGIHVVDVLTGKVVLNYPEFIGTDIVWVQNTN